MTHAELSEEFKKYHQKTWPERRVYANRTGFAKYPGQVVPYGIPAPLLGKKKKVGGGGADFFSFGNENEYFTVWFFEIKTLKDKMKPNQTRVAKSLTAQGANYWIVKEQEAGGFKLIRFQKDF